MMVQDFFLGSGSLLVLPMEKNWHWFHFELQFGVLFMLLFGCREDVVDALSLSKDSCC